MECFSTILCVLQLYCVVNGIPVLTITPSQNVLLNQLMTFTCTGLREDSVAVTFKKNRKEEICNLEEINGSCRNTPCFQTQTATCYNSTTYSVKMNVKQEWDNQGFTCESINDGVNSNSITIVLAVPVTSLALTPANSTVNIKDGADQIFTCITSPCRPSSNITWYKDDAKISGDSINISSPSDMPNKFITNGKLTVRGNKSNKKIIIKCEAANIPRMTPISQTRIINVIYPPEALPIIKATPPSYQYDNGTPVTLICELPGGNPIAALNWMCKGQNKSGSNQSTADMAISSLTLQMDSTYNGQQCKCTAMHQLWEADKTAHVSFTVFFPPTKSPKITASPSLPQYENGTSVKLTCNLSGGNPLATLTWHCKGEQVDGMNQNTNDEARSSLTLIMDSSYNGQQCICTAEHRLLSSSRRDVFTFTVLYAPTDTPSINVLPNTDEFREGTSVNLTCELSGGNPIAALSWICKGRDVGGTNQNVTGVAKSSIALMVDSTYNNRMCTCMAKHQVLKNPKSKNFTFSVLYNNKITSVKFIEGVSTIKEHGRLSLQCDVDGNPTSTILWEKNNNGTLLHKDTGVLRSTFVIPQANCRDTGLYKVTANNSIGQVAENVTTIYIECSPRLDDRFQNQSPKKIGIASNDSLHIQVGILSYPTPEKRNVVWTFMSNRTGENRTITDGDDHYHFSVHLGMIEQGTNLTKENLTSSDFGIYMLTIRNEEGTFSSHYEVVSARPPSIPSNFTLKCDINPEAAGLSWVSEFNGGDQQKFVPQYTSDLDKQFTDYSLVLDDKGLNVIHTGIVNVKQGNYWFRIKSSNKYGETYSEIIKCHVKGPEESSQIGLIAGVTSCVVVIAIICAIIVAVLLFRKGTLSGKKSGMNSSRSPLDIDNGKGEGDGLTDNVLYVSAGPRDVDEKPGVSGTGDVYSQVNKNQKKSDSNSNNVYAMVDKTKSNNQMEGPVYADVMKPKKGPKKDKGKKDKKDKKKKRQEQRIDVYENSEDIALKDTGMQSKAQERGYKNQDGLLYVDVQFDNKPNDHQGKPVIHGEEERTDYATVAFEFPQQPEPGVNNASKSGQSKENNK